MFLFVYRFAAIFTMIVWVIAYLNVAPYSAPDGEAVCRPASEASKPCSRCSLTSVARAAPRGARRAQASPPYVGPGVEAFKSSGAGSAPTPIVKRQAFAYFAVIALRPSACPGFDIVFATTCFAQLTHHSIPGLVQPMRLKKRLPKLFAQSMGITFIFYALLGALPSVYFGIYVRARVSWARCVVHGL